MNRLSRQIFEDFVVGDGNRAAFTAALEVANNPGIRYNPLFLYGGTGTGKSHLLSAIEKEASGNDPSISVHYMNYQTLSAQVMAALASGSPGQVRAALSQVDIFLLDDVCSDDAWLPVQREMIDWIDRLIQEERQIVFASDRSPLELDPFEERFLSRIQRGLIVSLERVDQGVKRELIARWMESEGVDSPWEAIEFLADLPVYDIRELSGIINRLLISLSADKGALTGEWMTSTLRRLIRTGEIRKFKIASTARPSGKAARRESLETDQAEETELAEEKILSIAEMDVQQVGESDEDEDESTIEERREMTSVRKTGGDGDESRAKVTQESKIVEIDESEGFFIDWDQEIDRLLDEL